VTLSTAWGILQSPLTNIGVGVMLAIGAFAFLTEYRRLFMQDPRAVMSFEVLMTIIARSGGPGYFAALLLAGALLNLAWGFYSLISRLSHVITF
jgi:hypothetical protein